MTDSLRITTNVEIDWYEFGREFAGKGSDDQALFILGFYEAVDDMQLAYIGADSTFPDDARNDVADVLETLAKHIREGGTKP